MPTLKISNTVTLDENEIEISAIRASGFGGQKVNKVSKNRGRVIMITPYKYLKYSSPYIEKAIKPL